jgi:hypothetical protein
MIYEQEFLEKIWDLSKEFKIQQKKYEWFELLKIMKYKYYEKIFNIIWI